MRRLGDSTVKGCRWVESEKVHRLGWARGPRRPFAAPSGAVRGGGAVRAVLAWGSRSRRCGGSIVRQAIRPWRRRCVRGGNPRGHCGARIPRSCAGRSTAGCGARRGWIRRDCARPRPHAPGDTHLIAGQVVGGMRDADLLEAFRRSRHIVPEILVVRLAVVRMEPGLDSRQVPNKAEQRELRRRHRPQRQLFRRQPATLQQQGRAVVLEAVFERGPLVNRVVRRRGSLGRGPCQHSGDFTYTRFLGQRAAVVGGSRHESSNPSTCTFPDTTVSATAEVRNRSQDGATVWATCQGWDGDRR